MARGGLWPFFPSSSSRAVRSPSPPVSPPLLLPRRGGAESSVTASAEQSAVGAEGGGLPRCCAVCLSRC